MDPSFISCHIWVVTQTKAHTGATNQEAKGSKRRFQCRGVKRLSTSDLWPHTARPALLWTWFSVMLLTFFFKKKDSVLNINMYVTYTHLHTTGNRPRLQDKQTVANLKGHAAYQRKLIHTAVALLKKGGTLVYSTCTINPLGKSVKPSSVLSLSLCLSLSLHP